MTLTLFLINGYSKTEAMQDVVAVTKVFDNETPSNPFFPENITRYDGLTYTGENESGTASGAELNICCGLGTDNLFSRWKTIDFVQYGQTPAADFYTSVSGMGVLNNVLYITLGVNNNNSSVRVLYCSADTKANGGDSNYCDDTADFLDTNNIRDGRMAWDLYPHNGLLYALYWSPGPGGKIYVCDPSQGGSSSVCDHSNDWSISWQNGESVQPQTIITHDGLLWVATVWDDNQIIYCLPETTGAAGKCEEGDWIKAVDRAWYWGAGEGDTDGATALSSFNGCVYFGLSRTDTQLADLYECCPNGNLANCDEKTEWDKIWDGTEMEISSMTTWKNGLYFGTGTTGAPGTHGNLYKYDGTAVHMVLDKFNGYANAQRILGLHVINNNLWMQLTSGAGETHGGDIYEISGQDSCYFLP